MTADPEQAEIILFVEAHHDDSAGGPFFEWIFRHQLYARYPDRVFVHCGMDRIVPLLPGIYPSIDRKNYRRKRMRSGSYLMIDNEHLGNSPLSTIQPTILGSFVGCARDVEVRHALLKVKHDRLLIKDNGEAFIGAVKAKQTGTIDDMKKQYVESLLASKFILCPRGKGASSIRLFETMEVGRVPVILSDQWVEPEGPNWKDFSIRIAERDVAKVPAILLEREADWPHMAVAARQAWVDYFGDTTIFHHTVEQCLDIKKLNHAEWLWRNVARLHLLKPANFRRHIKAR